MTGNCGEIGTGFSDFERNWVWANKEFLVGTCIKVKVFEATDTNFRAARFIEFHDGKGVNQKKLLLCIVKLYLAYLVKMKC